jgi:hypothetical protein
MFDGPRNVPDTMWLADIKGALFPGSRARRVDWAQDALTHAEESVYDCLWGPKSTSKEEFRIVQMGYESIARAATRDKTECGINCASVDR